ncbi:SDR family oxidoreductase [Marinobacter alexandrii]|uniref:UDP-glucose 4-epimerase family protein n=1 Tax=Marinobacter alexandrii TaxID=2570351 RepID=UPI001FFFC452|nr:SDR family oxidoreductase [Marinobacter alexandrii]MCK2150064.1 SDR family oxidoreductase [Marinobacter alexandrii]
MTSMLLVTGVTGFLGSTLVRELAQKKYEIVGVSRRPVEGPFSRLEKVASLSDLTAQNLSGVDTVIHCAARAHIMKDEVANPLAEYRQVNVECSIRLARQAAKAGVRRFIFISSIKVNGEQTQLGKPFTADDAPAPEDAYGISKMEAEQGLQALADETSMELVVIRPPLVYGPGVKGNFANMAKLVDKGLPLPLGAIHNKRSLVALDNLVDLIIRCIDHPAGANQVFLAGDGQDVSTTELLSSVGQAMSKPARLIPVPAGMLMFGASLLGKRAVAQRLLGSLQVDISKARNLLGWEPPLSVDEGLRRCFESENAF